MIDEVMLEAEERMEGAIESLHRELTRLRTGRANPQMLEPVRVDYYGAPTPINQVGNVSVPEANQIVVKPYDRSIVKEVEKAILSANLGITPSNEGDQIRIVLPPLTEERRKDLVKQVKKIGEDAKVAIRNIRRDANDAIKKLEKASDLTEDDSKGYQEDIQELTDTFIAKITKETEAKEKDLMTV